MSSLHYSLLHISEDSVNMNLLTTGEILAFWVLSDLNFHSKRMIQIIVMLVSPQHL